MSRRGAKLLRAPFPWFGGKSRVAHLVWERFGDVRNYVEPFFGSGAVLLGRPGEPSIETVNDADGYLANFWRAVAADPDEVARWADWPVNEADLHARHRWLVETGRERVEQVKSDPEYFDAKVAGWWVWGQCLWIGSGWCARPEWTGRANAGIRDRGINAAGFGKLPAIAGRDGGRGAYAKTRSTPEKRPALTGNGASAGVHKKSLGAGGWKKRPVLEQGEGGRGIFRTSNQVPDLSGDSGAAGRGIHASGFLRRSGGLHAYMQLLSERLRRVRVCCGDFERIIGTTGVFLDPPCPEDGRAICYTHDKRPVDARCSVEGYRVMLGASPVLSLPGAEWAAHVRMWPSAEALEGWTFETVGYLLFGRPQATRCYPWYGDPGAALAGKVECSRWEVLNLARVWLNPSVQAGGALCNPDQLPGFRDRFGTWRSALASTAVRIAADRVRLDYLLSRPPCFLDQPYQIRWLLSYCDTRLHRGVVYRSAGFELYRGPGSERPTGEHIQTWRLPLAPLSPAEDWKVREASRLSDRSRAYRDAREAGGMEQLMIGGLAS